MKKYIGIDVGKTGGIAVLGEDNSLILHPIPTIGKELDVQALSDILEQYISDDSLFAVEDVRSLPGVGSGSNFSFGNVKGLKVGILTALKARMILVFPKTWQKVSLQGVPIQKKANGKTDTKLMALIGAKRLFPTESFLATKRSSVPHDGLIDAALIAYYLKTNHRL
tara:strand:- start:2417 stop:2917 length:501 start_codon:yes stop_codon:yes gene_type:complete